MSRSLSECIERILQDLEADATIRRQRHDLAVEPGRLGGQFWLMLRRYEAALRSSHGRFSSGVSPDRLSGGTRFCIRHI